MPLWLRLTLASLVAAVAPLIILSVQAVELTGAQAESARRAALEREAVAISEEVGRWAEHQEQALAGWMALYPGLAERRADQQRGLLRAVFRAVPSVVTVALVDKEGELLTGDAGVTAPVLLTEAPLSTDPLAGRLVGSAERTASWLVRVQAPAPGVGARAQAPWLPDGALAPALPLAVRSPFAGDRAVLAADVSMAQVQTILELRSKGPWSVALYDQEGEAVLTNGQAIDPTLIRTLVGQDLAYVQQPEKGLRGSMAAVPGLAWSIVVTESSGAGVQVDDPRSQVLFALLISLMVAFVVGLILARPLSRPIGVLRQAANTIAEGDLSHRIPETGGPELAELARSFNEMAMKLSKSLAAIEAYNSELEDRVQDRTAELREAQKELVRAGQLAAVAEVGASLAHELNNPLAGILGLAQVLRAGSSDEMQSTLLEQVETQTQRCRQVVEAMLRLSSGDLDPVEAPVTDLAVVVAESAELVSGAFRQRGVQLRVQPVEATLDVRLEPVHGSRIVAQILQALCAGLPAGATLVVTLDRKGADVRVCFTPDQAVAVGKARDDFMASSLGLWVARQMLDARAGRLMPPQEGGAAWQMLLPEA